MGGVFLDVLPALVALAVTMMGNALLTTLLGLQVGRIDAEGALVGVVMAGYFVGFLASALLTPRLIRRVGHIRAFVTLALLGAAVPVLHAAIPTWWAWFLLRAAMGIAFAGIYVVVESWINQSTGNATRGRLLAIYMVTQGGAWSAGQFLLNVADPGGFMLFALASGLLAAGAAVIATAPIRTSRTPRIFHMSWSSPNTLHGMQAFGSDHERASLDRLGAAPLRGAAWALSSAGEHCFHTAGVAGSIPAAPTTIPTTKPPPSPHRGSAAAGGRDRLSGTASG